MLQELRHTAGRTIRNIRRPHDDFIAAATTRLAHVPMQTIFDVGAHIGMTALEFSDAFPEAVVHAFEPHPGNFERMKANLIGKPEVQLHQIGLGSQPGTLPFHFDPAHPSMARIAAHGETVTDTVEIDTIDRFCTATGIEQIDLLKVDVEGHEIPVFEGAAEMLSRGAIALIRVETAIDPDITYHTQLWDLCEVLHPDGYRLFGFYDQAEFPLEPDNAKLRRFDVAFISPKAQRR